MHPADLIFFWAKSSPERVAILELDMAITYGALAEAVESIAERVGGFNLDRGEPVAVLMERSAKQLAVCYALLRCGITAASINRRALPHLQANGIKTLIYDVAGESLPAGRNIRADDSWLRRGHRVVWNSARPSLAGSTNLLFFTSGTTGNPKRVLLPGKAFIDRVRLLPVAGEAGFGRSMVLPGLNSTIGFVRASMILYAGKTACFAGSADTQLLLISTYGVKMVSGSPQQVLDLVEAIEKGRKYRLDSLKEVRIGGGFASRDLVRRIQSTLCRNVMAEYGATEAGLLAIANYDLIADAPNSVGFVVPEATVEIVDEADNPLGRDEEGLIRCRSSYFAKVFAANYPERAGEADAAWWYPGDIGQLTKNGILCVGGRADDVINCGGVKVSGMALDEVIRRLPGIADAGVCGIRHSSGTEEIWAGIVAAADVDCAELKKLISAHPEVRVGPSEILLVENIPRNDLGKLQRFQLKEMLMGIKNRQQSSS